MVLLEEHEDPPWKGAERRVPAAGTRGTDWVCIALPPNKHLQPTASSLRSSAAA